MSTELEEKITTSLVDDQLPYASALKISKALSVTLLEIGETTEKLGKKISDLPMPGGWMWYSPGQITPPTRPQK